MKKNLTKPYLFASVIITVLLLTITFTSCEKETAPDSKYADSEYLDLEFYNKNRMTKKDFEIMSKAKQRFEISRLNGMYIIKKTTASELNISPKLFRYINSAYDYSNSVLNPQLYKKNTKKLVRLKSGNPEDEYNQQTDSTYCFSYAIAALGDYSLAECKEEQDKAGWGNGAMVPYNPTTGVFDANNAIVFFEKFYKDAETIFGQNLNPENGFMQGKVLFFRQYNGTGVTGSHAVNTLFYDESSEEFTCVDNQNGGRIINVSKSDVIVMFNHKN